MVISGSQTGIDSSGLRTHILTSWVERGRPCSADERLTAGLRLPAAWDAFQLLPDNARPVEAHLGTIKTPRAPVGIAAELSQISPSLGELNPEGEFAIERTHSASQETALGGHSRALQTGG